MFDIDQFIADCRGAVAEDESHKSVREVLARAVSNPAGVLKGLGEPGRDSRRQMPFIEQGDTVRQRRLHSRSGLSAPEADWPIFDSDNATKSVANGEFDPLQCCANNQCQLRNSPRRGDHRAIALQVSHTTSPASQKAKDKHHRINER